MRGYLVWFWCVVAMTVLVTADVTELSITTIKQEPYVMDRGPDLEGFCVDLIAALSKKVGFKYKLHLVRDNRYGALDPSGNWNGMMGEVVRGEADLAVAPLTLTAVREQFVDMTAPFIQTGISFLMHQARTSTESSVSLMDPFSSDMWAGLLLAFLLTGTCLFLVGRISPTEWAELQTDQHTFTLLHSFWYITGALTLQGAGPHPKSVSGRVVSAIWWLFAILLLASYFGNFHLLLNSDNQDPHIKTFEDLANQDVMDYGTVEGGSTMSFFENSNNLVYRRMFQHMERKKSFVSSMEEGIRRARDGNFAFIGEAVSLDLAVARYCELSRSQDVISMKAYAIAAPLGSPLMKNLTVAVLQLSESGELTYLRDKWWASSCLASEVPRAPGAPRAPKALRVQDLCGLFFLLGLGLVVGVVLGLLELLSGARSRARDSEKSFCSVLTSELQWRFANNGLSAQRDGADKNKA